MEGFASHFCRWLAWSCCCILFPAQDTMASNLQSRSLRRLRALSRSPNLEAHSDNSWVGLGVVVRLKAVSGAILLLGLLK